MALNRAFSFSLSFPVSPPEYPAQVMFDVSVFCILHTHVVSGCMCIPKHLTNKRTMPLNRNTRMVQQENLSIEGCWNVLMLQHMSFTCTVAINDCGYSVNAKTIRGECDACR